MESLLNALGTLDSMPLPLGLCLLGACAMIEYLFPPFPGDVITITGAVLIPTAGWPWWGVFGAVMAGSLVGSGVNWKVGTWLVDEQKNTWLHRWSRKPSVARKIRAINQKFERRGLWVLVWSRFVPAFRSVFFLAAGMAGLPGGKVVAAGALSAALWNACLLGVGLLVGYNIERIAHVVGMYSGVVLGVLVVCALGWGLKAWVARRRAGQEKR